MNYFTEILHNTSRQIIAERMNAAAEQKSGGSLRSANPVLFSYICTGLRDLISCVHNAVPCSQKSHRDIKEVRMSVLHHPFCSTRGAQSVGHCKRAALGLDGSTGLPEKMPNDVRRVQPETLHEHRFCHRIHC